MASSSSSSVANLRLRRAYVADNRSKVDDATFILHAFDSALPYLSARGSGAQWGDVPFSEKPKVVEEVKEYVRRSARSEYADEEQQGQEGQEEWTRILIAETPVSSNRLNELSHALDSDAPPSHMIKDDEPVCVRTGALCLTSSAPSYAHRYCPPEAQERLSPSLTGSTGGPFLYIAYLIVDRRVGDWGKGTGGRLLQEAKKEARSRNCTRLLVDCWRGNGGGLIR